jgi:hypothetical protein
MSNFNTNRKKVFSLLASLCVFVCLCVCFFLSVCVSVQGILKGKYHCTIDLLFHWFGLVCFANKNKNCRTADSKPVKQKVNVTVILPPLVFPGLFICLYACLPVCVSVPFVSPSCPIESNLRMQKKFCLIP